MINLNLRQAPLLLIAIFAFSGCVATQSDILSLSQQTDSMTLKVHQLKRLMVDLQGNQADLNVKLDDLHRSVSILNENLQDNRDSMSRLSSKMDDFGVTLGMKVSTLDYSIKKNRNIMQRAESSRKKDTAELKRSAQVAQRERTRLRKAETIRRKREEAEQQAREDAFHKKAEEEAAAKLATQGPPPSEVYNSARVQLGKKEYELAAKGFEVYLEKYPKGEVADQATYYLGQTRYSQKRWRDAARQFALTLDRYPKSDITPAARLRYALSLMKMKTALQEAKRYLQSIPQDFPKSPEAHKAREILRTWKEMGSKKKSSKREG